MFHRHRNRDRCDGPRERHAHGPFGRAQFGRGERHGRGGLGRFFDHGDLRFVILQLVAEKPRHGYEIIKAIEDRLGGAYSPSPGVIYPTLTMLEEAGYAAITAIEGSRKLYGITPEGETHLQANRAAVDAIAARIAEIGEARGGPAPHIMRAMHNLRLALRMRFAAGGLTPEQVERIVATLDAAAREVEKS